LKIQDFSVEQDFLWLIAALSGIALECGRRAAVLGLDQVFLLQLKSAAQLYTSGFPVITAHKQM